MREKLQATLGSEYAIERELGGGGMSRVYLAEETALGRKVVIKVVPTDLLADGSAERFHREILLAAKLQHPHIVPVLHAGVSDGVPFYTMPYVEGESLRARLTRGPLPIAEAVGILRDVAKALAYAHERGIIHRDIKPDNVLLSSGSATVTDFGIAKAISALQTSESPIGGQATLTQVGMSIGTPTYMAPEQAAGDPSTDHRADIYAFGCMAFELLAGTPPFAARGPQALLAAHLTETPQAIFVVRPDTPPLLSSLVMRCLSKLAAERPQSASELVRALDAVSSGGASVAAPVTLLGGAQAFYQAIALYAVAFVLVAVVAKYALSAIGLPDWVFPGALIVMALGFPVILWTGYVQRVARHATTATPTITPGGSAVTASQGPLATMALKQAPRVTFSRTARMGVVAMGVFALAVVVFMTMRALNIGPAKTLFGSGALSAQDRLVMTTFTSSGSDSALGRVTSFAVRTVLDQSTALKVVTEEQVAATLDLMNRPRNAPVDLALARGIAAREGAKAIVDGEVATVGSGYVLTVRLVSADSGSVLATFQQAGDGPRGLIDAADKVAKALRGKAGESLKSVQSSVPLWRARTSSLEALRYFSEAVYVHRVEFDWQKAIALYRQALARDSTFAEAWMRMGTAMSNLSYPRIRSDSALRKAYALRERLPDGERAQVEGTYFGFLSPRTAGPGRDRPRAIESFLRDGGRVTNLGLQYLSRREFATAESALKALAVDTTYVLALNVLQSIQRFEGKYVEAESTIALMRRRSANSIVPRRQTALLAYDRGQLDRFAQAIDSLRAAGDTDFAITNTSQLALLRGGLRSWQSLEEEFRRRQDQRIAAGATAAGQGLVRIAQAARSLQQVTGTPATRLWKAFDSALTSMSLSSMYEPDRPDLELASELAWAGRSAQAKHLVEGFLSGVRDTAVQRWQQPAVQRARGAIAVAEGRYAEAIRELRKGDSLPDGPADALAAVLPLNLGRAFDAAGMRDSTIVQFERYLATPSRGLAQDAATLPLVRERLGQLYDAKGEAEKAVEHYRAFIALWERADPELQPRVAAAKATIAKLMPVERIKR